MKALFSAILVAALIGLSTCWVTDQIYSAPRDTNPLFLNETYYAGFFPIGTRGSLFYWLFESRGNPATDPLVIWLTGGPGCSSEIAIFIENGPFNITKSNNSLITNPWSWNTNANVLYIDQPLGTGFSTANVVDETEAEIAEHFLVFLNEFLQGFPEYVGRDFFITGESYAGHYIPSIASYLITQQLSLNFVGVAIGNGLVDPYQQYPQYAVFAHENGLIDDSAFTKAKAAFVVCQTLIKTGANKIAYDTCELAVDSILGNPPKWNVYDIRLPCSTPPLCYDLSFVDTFLTQSSVLQALGVSGRPWAECNDTVNSALQSDYIIDYSGDIAKILAAGKQVLVYSGDKDFICNWRGGEAWTNNLDWPSQSIFAGLNYTIFEGYGEYKYYNNLTFFRVYDAGHMVPMDQPETALVMFQRFLNGWENY